MHRTGVHLANVFVITVGDVVTTRGWQHLPPVDVCKSGVKNALVKGLHSVSMTQLNEKKGKYPVREREISRSESRAAS
eukprot:scaffold253118_cov28-Tisochrysis_lutea.AAC.2